ncbi:MAG: YgiQ family radical SAM protein [Lachnospiraceae bacterium]|nr:YgiQ family radical SAM protein [Lachnospiraceae bacterium]
MLSNIEAVIFDLDGSLVDSMWMWRQIDIEYLGKYGIQLPEDLQKNIEGMSFSETAVYFKETFLLPDSLEEIKAEWNRMAWDKYTHEVPLKRGVRSFLDYCRAKGIALGIATSNSRELVENVIHSLGLKEYFSCIMTGCDVNKGKPSPDIYLAVAKELKAAPQNCLVFEDIVMGIKGGKSAGMKVCAVEDEYSLYQKEEKLALADYYIRDYFDLNYRFLPVCPEDMEERGIKQFDFVYVVGDAYVDHPSFGHAVISRVLEAHGYTVGLISQPDWKDEKSIAIYGEPRLGFLISAGNMDSMVNHYFVSKKHRPMDAYTPGGEIHKRPDRATAVYGNLIRKTYKNTPIIIGGIEASLRRMAHYDYWSDSFKRSVLLDTQADLLLYGMGEKSIVEVADALNSGIKVSDITFIKGTVYKTKDLSGLYNEVYLPDYETMKQDKLEYARSFNIQYENTDPFYGKVLVEGYPGGIYVVQNPPQPPLNREEMDAVYELPFTRTYHPSYLKKGGVPAINEIQFSLISNRGCFGGCNFCALTFHQGRIVQSRSHESILKEARQMTTEKGFKGYIHDVGGPTANFRHPSCEKQLEHGVCKHRQCLTPTPCKNLTVDHTDYRNLLRKLRAVPGVKKVFIRSGIRFDYLMEDKDDSFFRELVQYHVSGQLKVAPEHISDAVLRKMDKPANRVYERFQKKYKQLNQELGLKQYLVPYLMSSHPGSTLKEAIELAEYLRDLGYMPEQVQDFYPTPSTMSTVMYYTEVDPRDMKPVYICKNPHEKAMQRALIQYRNPKNYELVKEALLKAGREDLIGFDKHCLIRPRSIPGEKERANSKDLRKKQGTGVKKTASTKPSSVGKSVSRKPKQKKTIRNVHKKKG